MNKKYTTISLMSVDRGNSVVFHAPLLGSYTCWRPSVYEIMKDCSSDWEGGVQCHDDLGGYETPILIPCELL